MDGEIKLPDNTLEDIRSSEKRIKNLENFIAKASAAGMSMDSHRARLAEAKSRLNRLKTAFFPGQSS